jgi:hypothetical protein
METPMPINGQRFVLHFIKFFEIILNLTTVVKILIVWVFLVTYLYLVNPISPTIYKEVLDFL